jgi:hypothetical protein
MLVFIILHRIEKFKIDEKSIMKRFLQCLMKKDDDEISLTQIVNEMQIREIMLNKHYVFVKLKTN